MGEGAQRTLYVNSTFTPATMGCGFSDVRFTWIICAGRAGPAPVRAFPHHCSESIGGGKAPLHAHPVLVVVDVKALVGVDVDVLLVLGLFWGRPHKAPHGQVIDEQLVPAARQTAMSVKTLRDSAPTRLHRDKDAPVVLLDSLPEDGCTGLC